MGVEDTKRSLRRRRLLLGLAGGGIAGVALFFALHRPAEELPPPAPASPPPPAREEPAPTEIETTAQERVTPPPPVEEEPAEEVPLEDLRSSFSLYGTANVKPVYNRYDVEGVRILNVQPGSFWAMLGVQSGDVITELNSDPIDSPADTIALMNALERDPVVRLGIRNAEGDERTIEYSAPR